MSLILTLQKVNLKEQQNEVPNHKIIRDEIEKNAIKRKETKFDIKKLK